MLLSTIMFMFIYFFALIVTPDQEDARSLMPDLQLGMLFLTF